MKFSSLEEAQERMHLKCDIARKKLTKLNVSFKEEATEKKISFICEGFRFVCFIEEFEDTDYDKGFIGGFEFAAKRMDSFARLILEPGKNSEDNEPLKKEMTRKIVSRIKMMYQNDIKQLVTYSVDDKA